MNATLEAATVQYREDRWWSILAAIGECMSLAPYSWNDRSEVVAEVYRSKVVEDYWPVSITVLASFHTVVTHGRPAGFGAGVSVHEVMV